MAGDLGADHGALVELHGVALAVGEADGLDALVALQRPGEADGGVLPAGEQHEGTPYQPLNPQKVKSTRPTTRSMGTKPTPKRGDCTRLSVELGRLSPSTKRWLGGTRYWGVFS